MALEKIITLSLTDFNTLSTTGTVTIGGTTLTYQPNDVLYLVPDSTQSVYRHRIQLELSNVGYIEIGVNLSSSSQINSISTLSAIKNNLAALVVWLWDGASSYSSVMIDDIDAANQTITYYDATGHHTVVISDYMYDIVTQL